MAIIKFQYMNHRGEIRERSVDVDALEFFFVPIWGYQPGWFISGLDLESMQRRSFSLNRIIFPEGEEAQKFFHLGMK